MSDTTACIGVDPGFRWTAAVLRVGDTPINGFTLGPVARDGQPARKANDSISPDALARYTTQIGVYLDKLYDQAVELNGGPPLVAVEMPTPGEKYRRIPLRAWLTTWTVAWNVVGRFDGVIRVTPDNHGVRHQVSRGGNGRMRDYYPADLCRSRPGGWLQSVVPRTARDHERAAYDVAGVAIKQAGEH